MEKLTKNPFVNPNSAYVVITTEEYNLLPYLQLILLIFYLKDPLCKGLSTKSCSLICICYWVFLTKHVFPMVRFPFTIIHDNYYT